MREPPTCGLYLEHHPVHLLTPTCRELATATRALKPSRSSPNSNRDDEKAYHNA